MIPLLLVTALAKKEVSGHRIAKEVRSSSGHGSASRVVEGDASSPGLWPWMATLLLEADDDRTSKLLNQDCGGTLVHEDWVLTAAHCLDWYCPTRQFSVLIGATNLDTWFDESFDIGGVSHSPELRRIEAFVVHPDYIPEAIQYISNFDIALVKLAAPSTLPPVQLNSGDQTAFVEQQRQRNASIALGWGDTTDLELQEDFPSTLQYASLPLVEDAVCDENLRTFRRENLTDDPDPYYYDGFDGPFFDYIDFDLWVCAGTEQLTPGQATSSTCSGDSGGPLLIRRDGSPAAVPAAFDEWLQVGVDSWSRGCADGYGLFTEVAAFESFITDVISGAITATPAPTTVSEDPIRLVDGTTDYEGRLEIFHDGVWGTVCDVWFSIEDATVVCRQLFGTDAIDTICCAEFGEGPTESPIWMAGVSCSGSEPALSACCSVGGWGFDGGCDHSLDVGVSCMAPEQPPTTPVPSEALTTPAPTVTPAPAEEDGDEDEGEELDED